VRHNGHVLRSLRTIFDAGTVAGLTDGQLLERFATRSGSPAELAFAALVERHGPMVLRVCRNHLGDHDAQDAFQATFLVLVRQARTLWVRDSLGPWLHRVAQRSARRARREARRRKAIEQAAAEQRAAREQPTCPDGDELGPLLHEEIDRLPERLRVPLVLCELEGRTQEEAARHLGCPVGTVKSRLARGRARLRQRLLRRGLAPALAGPLVSIEAARAAVPAGLKELMITRLVADLAGKAVPGAFPASVTALTEGVLRTMFLIKLKTIAAGLGLAVAATGAGVLANQLPPGADHHEGSGQPAAAPAASADTITVLGTPSPNATTTARDPTGATPSASPSWNASSTSS
jgi:HlyD family secretion protein